jgi:hypothetical protein
MNEDRREFVPTIADDIEEAIDDKREGIVAADATGMVSNEQFITVAELREGEQPPVA